MNEELTVSIEVNAQEIKDLEDCLKKELDSMQVKKLKGNLSEKAIKAYKRKVFLDAKIKKFKQILKDIQKSRDIYGV